MSGINIKVQSSETYAECRMAMALQLHRFYQRALVKYPYAVQGVQVSVLMTASDLIAQCAVEKTPIRDINWTRTAQFGTIGLFFVGPVLRAWFSKLESSISPNQKPLHRALKKVALDQLIMAPSFTAVFTTMISAIQGMNSEQITERFKSEYPQILKTNYLLWPAAQLINFSVIPLNFQVVFAQVVAVIWNTYLSMTLGEKTKKEER